MQYRKIAVGDNGRRVGESHPKAKLTDHDIDLIRELATERDEQGKVVKPGLSYRTLAEKFETARGTIRNIVKCYRRAAIATRVRMVPVTES